MKLDVVILAAGAGTRMNSALPKALQKIAGKTMLEHVLEAVKSLQLHNIHIVIGHLGQQIKSFFSNYDLNFIAQKEQLGTGHALQQALPYLKSDLVLVLYADVPLVKTKTLQHLIDKANLNTLSLLTVELDNSHGYGRIVRNKKSIFNKNNNITAIVEQKDATAAQLKINEVNTGILVAPVCKLHNWLARLSNNNAQGEYYLTDIVSMAVKDKIKVSSLVLKNDLQVQGANNKQQLALLERYYQNEQVQILLDKGVTLFDPLRLDIRGNVSVGRDVSIDINCIFIGEVIIGDNVIIEANCIIKNSILHNNCVIKASSHLEQVEIGANASCGPFARLRPKTKLDNNSHVGNFVELKNTHLEEGVKVGHLTYLGDAQIEAHTNIGAGTISCNYDGKNKHQTKIGKNSFIGSNTSLVAPVILEEGTTTGAGSVITRDVPKNNLAISRSPQRNIANWRKKEE